MKKTSLLLSILSSLLFFTRVWGQVPGTDCSNPLVIGSLPYQHLSQNTSTYGDNYSTTPCNSSYIGGDEVVYTYMPSTTGDVSIDVTNLSSTWAGVMLLNACPDVASTCLNQVNNGSSSADMNITATLTAGTTYYIIISTYPSPQSVGYDLSISSMSCPPPTGINASAVTNNSANLSWTTGGASNWNTAIVLSGNPITTVTAVTVTSTAITGLQPSTTYDFYVQDSCGVGDASAWVKYTFSTSCAAIVAPFSESFDGTSIPNCWSDDPGTLYWLFSTGGGYGASAAGDHSGNGGNYAWVDGSLTSPTDSGVLVSPVIDLSALNTPYLTYSLFSNNINDASQNTFSAHFYDGANWNKLQEISANTNGWIQYAFDLSQYTISGNTQLKFKVVTNGSPNAFYNDILIDDISIVEAPSCLAPGNVTATNISYNSADISWVTGGAADWNFAIVEYGQPITSYQELTATSITLNNLQPVTTYQIYVRDSCGVGDVSNWQAPYEFTTLCPPAFDLPYLEDFSTFLPSCWQKGVGPQSGPLAYDMGFWMQDDFKNSMSNGPSARISLFSNNTKQDWLISPKLNMNAAGTYSLEFDYTVVASSYWLPNEQLGSDDIFEVLASTDGGTSWSQVAIWNADTAIIGGDPNSGGIMHYIFDVSTYAGNDVQFGLWATDGTVDDGNPLDVFVDNFQVKHTPVAGCNISVTVSALDASTPGGSDGAVATTVSGAQSNLTYNWSNAATTANITGLSAGTYSVTVTDDIVAGCFDVVVATVSEAAASVSCTLSTTISGNNVTSNGGTDGSATIVISGNQGSIAYTWSNAQTTDAISGLSAGVYSVTVVDNVVSNCNSVESVTITEPAVTVTPPICALSVTVNYTDVSTNGGSDGSATVVVSGGQNQITYNWSHGATVAVVNNLSAGEYTVTVSDDITANCNLVATITVSEPSVSTTGIDGLSDVQAYTIYPNPSSGKFYVNGIDPNNSPAINVYSIDGKRLSPITNVHNNDFIEIDMGSYSSGIYFIKINSSVTRLVIK